MRKIIFIGLILLALATTAVMAQQASEKESSSPMQGMMQGMMKEGKAGESDQGGSMQGMMGMMMKMMEQCNAMMASSNDTTKKPQETPHQ